MPTQNGLPGASARHAGGLYYGWVLVWTLAVTQTVSWGIVYYCFSVFIAPMEHEMGWTRDETSAAFSLAILASGIAAIPVGRWLDRHGPRLLMTVGSAGATVTMAAWSQVDSLLALYVVAGALGVSMAATLYEPAFFVVATWFERDRGRALAIVTFLGGLASTIFVPLAALLIEWVGWRTALVVLALLLGAITIPAHAVFLRSGPAQLGLTIDGVPAEQGSGPARTTDRSWRTIIGARRFWWLTAAFSLHASSSIAITVHLLPFLAEIGLSTTVAATYAGLIGLSSVGGRVLLGRVWRPERLPRLAAAAFVAAAAATVLLMDPGPSTLVAFVVIFGMARGAATMLRAGLIAAQGVGGDLGVAAAVVAAVTTAATSCAPYAAGLGREWAGSYPPVFLILTLMWVAAAIAVTRTATANASGSHEQLSPAARV